jgi:hypothetical protein
MDINKINQDLQKTYQQINNLEVINDKSDITIDIPDKVMLDKLYNDFKTFDKSERNIFLSQISKIKGDGMNSKNKNFSTMKTEQRTFLLEKLNQRVIEMKKRLENTETEIIANNATNANNANNATNAKEA